MKLYELIQKLEKLEQEGKRDYEVKVAVYNDEYAIDEKINYDDHHKMVYL